MYKILVLLQPVNRLVKERLLDKELCMRHNQNTYHDQQQIIGLMLSLLVLRVSASYFLFERKFSKSKEIDILGRLGFLISNRLFKIKNSRNINLNFLNFFSVERYYFHFLSKIQSILTPLHFHSRCHWFV